jgi:nucleobase:cation symporter-1, NCS1 family
MAEYLRQRKVAIQEKVQSHSTLSGWLIEPEPTTFAEEGTASNKDSDVTPVERRTWTSLTVIGFWCSDCLNAQGWEGPSSIIAVGLTWKEAFYLRESEI